MENKSFDLKNIIGKGIIFRRKIKGYTPSKLAEIVGVKQQGQQTTFLIPKDPGWWDNLHPVKLRPIPVLNDIPAGEPADFTDQEFIVGHSDRYISSNVRNLSAYALVVRGDSMKPLLKDGTDVTVSPNSEVTNNSIVVFRIKENSDAGIKRFKQIGNSVHLIPENESYEICVHDISEFVFIHRVVKYSGDL